jgi:hypothetical protein
MHLAAGEATLWAMTDDKVKRRLTTVLCADVHGYSRLMEADEAGTLRTLRRYRTAIAGLVERHDGRIVNTWGDAVIAEFASVVEAVQCAVGIQQEMSNTRQYHDRMPLVLEESQFDDWMRGPTELAAEMMKPCGGAIEASEVGAEVGNVRNNRPELMDRVGLL